MLLIKNNRSALDRMNNDYQQFICVLNEMNTIYCFVLQGFTTIQLGYFTTTQAAKITVSQYQSLSFDQQQVINNKLSAIKSDLVTDPASGGTGSGQSGELCVESPVRLLHADNVLWC